MTFKKGDLVMVVRPMPCCGAADGLGTIRTVEGSESGDGWMCGKCGQAHDGRRMATFLPDDAIPTCMLIKIDPPADDTEQVADKELEGVV